jgi:hypothetical protein
MARIRRARRYRCLARGGLRKTSLAAWGLRDCVSPGLNSEPLVRAFQRLLDFLRRHRREEAHERPPPTGSKSTPGASDASLLRQPWQNSRLDCV